MIQIEGVLAVKLGTRTCRYGRKLGCVERFASLWTIILASAIIKVWKTA